MGINHSHFLILSKIHTWCKTQIFFILLLFHHYFDPNRKKKNPHTIKKKKKKNLKATNDSKIRGARKNSFWLKTHISIGINNHDLLDRRKKDYKERNTTLTLLCSPHVIENVHIIFDKKKKKTRSFFKKAIFETFLGTIYWASCLITFLGGELLFLRANYFFI